MRLEESNLTLTPQGGGEVPKNSAGHLVSATWWLLGFVVVATYAANMGGEEDNEDTEAILLDNLGGVFIVIFAGNFLAVITLGFDYCYYKKKDHSRVESAVVKISGLVEDVERDF